MAVALEDAGRIFIDIIRDLGAGDELFIDYPLDVGKPLSKAMPQCYACQCEVSGCRHTMLAVAG